MVLQTTNFDNIVGTTCKNIKFATVHEFTEYQKECWKFNKKEGTDIRSVQSMGYEGFGGAPEVTESGDITAVDFSEGYKTTITQKQFAYETIVSWDQMRFAVKSAAFGGRIGFFLGRSANIRYEYLGTDTLTNGFTDSAAYHGGDSKPLFSATHPWKVGGTYSNVLASADASKTTISTAIKTVANAKMEQNIPANLTLTDIIFGYENVIDIPEILKSSLDPESGNNRYNALKDYGLNMLLLHYVTDTDATYYNTKDSELVIIEANSPFMKTEMYRNMDTGEKIFMSAKNGFRKPLGIFGNAGA